MSRVLNLFYFQMSGANLTFYSWIGPLIKFEEDAIQLNLYLMFKPLGLVMSKAYCVRQRMKNGNFISSVNEVRSLFL